MVEKDPFVRRWARRKEAVRRERDSEAKPAPSDEKPSPPAPSDDASADPAPDSDSANLPDIDSLDETSDYRAFMREGVPDELRNRALRKLWRSNPIFGEIDGLDEYAEDFTDAALAVKGPLSSIYKVGQGYRKDETPATAEDEGDAQHDGEVEEVEADATEADTEEEVASKEVENGTESESGDSADLDDDPTSEKS